MLRRAASFTLAASLTIACAPIDVTTTHSLQPRPGPTLLLGEQLVDRHFEVDWVQMGPRVLVELHEERVCATVSHVPVMRIEDIQRKARGFIAWDFALFGVTGGLAALAFARPQSFSPRLISSDGRYLIDTKVAYVTGGVFAGIATILLVAGVVNSIKATDETRYAAAYEVELGPEQACAGVDALPLRERELELVLADRAIVIAARSDGEGRARFELPVAWPEGVALPSGSKLAATITIVGELRTLAIDLRVPWWTAMIDAHTGHADTRERPLEGPRAPEDPA
ncbi:hypothetical protein ACNOYE_12180 [Nannocystaceae bacterium ST9]